MRFAGSCNKRSSGNAVDPSSTRPGRFLSRTGVISVAYFKEIIMDLTINENTTPYKLQPSEQERVINLALAILEERHLPGEALTSTTSTKNYLRIRLTSLKNEQFYVLFLDSRHRVLSFEALFFGTVDAARVHIRVVLQRCIALNAAAVIFAHNHPSGDSEPSSADLAITHRLKETLAYVDVRVLDHMIVGTEGITSLAERGEL